jgi:hypothetical protein
VIFFKSIGDILAYYGILSIAFSTDPEVLFEVREFSFKDLSRMDFAIQKMGKELWLIFKHLSDL